MLCILLQVYIKKRVSFAFASDYASAIEGRDYLVGVNINNNHGLPVSKIRLDIEVSYGFNGNKTKYMLTNKNIWELS